MITHGYTLFFCAGDGNVNEQVWWGITTLATLAISIIGFFLKKTISKTDEHDRDINVIKQNYVRQDDFKAYQNQSREDFKQLTADINELKEKCLFREDFYRTQAATNQQLDRIYDMVYQMNKGGANRGQ